MKKAGILLPIASLPSGMGIGDFGYNAYRFIDILKKTGIKIWQILPLNPLGYGNSPYQPYSSYAGDELYISLEKLSEQGLIKSKLIPFRKNEKSVDYTAVRSYKEEYLKEAFTNFIPDENYKQFLEFEWVYSYSVYITLKKANNLVCWNEWIPEHKEWIHTKELELTPYQNQMNYEMFLQYLFYSQWMEVKQYANKQEIKIMGDIPFYVGIDSLDVWANQECFLLGADGKPVFIAGVPPDYFSVTGQRWGNPIYNWKAIKEKEYKFWLDRIGYNSKLFDIIRIDHFRAFDTYWQIPVTCETAEEGTWQEAPGYEVLDKITAEFPEVEIVAEDLGELREEVHKLKNHYGLKGMKIVQFAFDPKENNNAFDDVKELIIYTGTHDNQTIKGWFLSQEEETQRNIDIKLRKLGYVKGTISERFICLTLNSVAEIAILPLQDVLGLGDEARINTPGTLGSPNWEWKLKNFKKVDKKAKFLSMAVDASERNNDI